MKIKDITSYLESFAPLSSQASFDNCGLLVGDSQMEVTGVLVTLDCIEATIDEAIEIGANLIIAHHPIIFSGLKKLNGKNYVERTVIKAIKNDIAIYAIHTNLDHYHLGVNYEICNRLGVKNTQILQPNKNVLSKIIVYVPFSHQYEVENAMFSAGAGRIGNYSECSFKTTGIGSFKPLDNSKPFSGKINERSEDSEVKIEVLVSNHNLSKVVAAMHESHPYEEVAYDILSLSNSNPEEGSGMIGELETPMNTIQFLNFMKKEFNIGVIRYTNIHKEEIKKIAVCGGAGAFLLNDAKRKNADIYITADFKYHEFFDAENQIIIADIGHYESEQFTTNLLVGKLKEKFTKFAINSTRLNTNPIKYL